MVSPARPLTSVLALSGLFISTAILIFVSPLGSAQSAEVKLSVPAGFIEVIGKSSPGAQVEIYENGNTEPAASVLADADGSFSEELPQMSTGVVDIALRVTDTNGKQSMLVTKQVAIIAQQTSTLTVVLPPSITPSPATATYGQGTVEFSGRTIPGATVEIKIEPTTVLTTTADSLGSYKVPLLVESLPSIGVYSYGIQVFTGEESSDYATAGTILITPPAQPPVIIPGFPIQNIVDRITQGEVRPPEISFPTEAEYNGSDPIVMSGRASPGAEVTIYDDGMVIGVVLAGPDGTWQFYFSPHKEIHSLYARACVNGKCSDNSRSIRIVRPQGEESQSNCRLGVVLKEYRLTTLTGSPVELSGTLPKGTPVVLDISWGDGNRERFDTPEGGRLGISHTYKEAGNYSGYIIADNGSACQVATYFAVEVNDPIRPQLALAIAGAVLAGAVSLWVLLSRLLPYLRR